MAERSNFKVDKSETESKFRFALCGPNGSLFNFTTSYTDARKHLMEMEPSERSGVSIVPIDQ